MPCTSVSNEQKLDEIYHLMIQAETRRRRANWLRMIKWVILLGLTYLVVTRPDMIMGRITEALKPIVMSTASGMISSQKSEINEMMKNMLAPRQ